MMSDRTTATAPHVTATRDLPLGENTLGENKVR
jgi:hypothetical protein